jgi:hypothetical protein
MEPASVDDPRGPCGHPLVQGGAFGAIERLKALLSDEELRLRIEDTARGGSVGALADLVAEVVENGVRIGIESKDPNQERP